MQNKQKIKSAKRIRRKARVRAQVYGTAKRPRLSVFRSLKHISVQLIDDEKSKTLVSATSQEVKKKKSQKVKKVDLAFEVGKLLAKKALDKKIKVCVFDKSGYKYHGRVKAIAEGAREGGLKF